MKRSLVITVQVPLFVSTAEEPINEELAGQTDTWSHTIQADGGFWEASLGLSCGRASAEDWLLNGLGRNVQATSGGRLVWEGFINSVAVHMAGTEINAGPLMEVANKVRALYRTISINVTPPIPSYPAKTGFAEDEASQDRYGVHEVYLSYGETTATLAEQARDLYLAEHANPKPTSSISLPTENGPLQVSVRALGYIHMLRWYAYNQAVTGGSITIPAKIQAILAANPNANIFSANYDFDSNATTVPAYENDNQLALEIINEHVAIGDASNNRYVFGIFDRRVFRYQAVPNTGLSSDISYYHTLSENDSAIADGGGAIIPAWEIEAGRWIHRPDFLIGQISPADNRLDPRSEFIESVTFTMPDQVEINGQPIFRLPQLLARLGLGGA